MAKSPHSKPKAHVLLCCFGFSGKVRRFKPLKPGHERKRHRLFSWKRLQAKPPVAKQITVPPISSMTGKPNEQNLSKPDSERLTSGRSIAPTTSYKQPNEDLSGEIKPEEVKRDSVAEKIIHESSDYSNSPKKLACQSHTRFSFSRKLESFRSARFTQPASPKMKKDLKSTNPTPAISHSLSFPTLNPTHISQVEDSSTKKRVMLSKVGEASGERGKLYGPAAGMSILIIMLAIMIVWGRLCAILCTAAWLFIVTSLRSTIKESHNYDFNESNSYSEWIKKKLVILKGFLPRNQRENLC